MENRTPMWMSLVGAALVGGFCTGQRWVPPSDPPGPQCTTCCIVTTGWRLTMMPDGSLKYSNTQRVCGSLKFLSDSASPDPGDYALAADSASVDSASMEVGSFVADSLILFGRTSTR